jgi:hypothetical protein
MSKLLSSLLEACAADPRFCHLCFKERKYIIDDRVYNVITQDMVDYLWCLPGVLTRGSALRWQAGARPGLFGSRARV